MAKFGLCALLLLVLCCYQAPAQAQTLISDIHLCVDSPEPPSNQQGCTAVTSIAAIDPQNRQLWVMAKFEIASENQGADKPLGLFISGKAASEIFINGVKVGQNGRPAANPVDESPGVMDYVLYLPRQNLREGSNTLMLRLSSHHGFLTLASPIHFIGIADYADPVNHRLSYYWKTLLPFGVLVIGAIYMGLLVGVRRRYWPDSLLPLMSLFAACQLLAEVSRGLIAYEYWVHDLRLLAILGCSAVFGLGLFTYTAIVLGGRKWRLLIMAVVAITLGGAYGLAGFDYKSVFVLIFPTLMAFSLALISYLIKQHTELALRFLVIYFSFLLIIVLSLTKFLDITFYYIIAALLIILFVNEVDQYVTERKAHVAERARADKLQTALEQHAQQDHSQTIDVGGAGSVEKVLVCDIVFCKGAGDYVELVLTSGKSVLHSERLNELEKNLPSLFLRVHRSYLVNTTTIKALQRKPSGVGELALSNGESVPVSRRIMPSVRDKLKEPLS